MPKEERASALAMFHPVETKRASEAIYEQIRELILCGDLKPDDRLPSERSMMETFHRSRPTVREALRMLERSGYIRTIPGSSGAVVMHPNNKNLENSLTDALRIGMVSLDDIAEYRLASELATAGWAAQRCTPEDIQAMEQYLAKMEAAIPNSEDFVDMDSGFHGLVAKAAKNDVSQIFSRVFSRLNRSFAKKKMATMSEEERAAMVRRVHSMHLAIFQAIREHDAVQAQKAMEEHLKAFGSELKYQ